MKPIWLAKYPAGVPATIDPGVYTSINAMLEDVFAKYKNLPAFSALGQTLTYAEIDELSRRFAAFLQNKLGIEKGDRFAILLPNVIQYPIAMIGILRAGAIVVNTNILFTADEFVHQMRDCQAKGIIVLENFAHMVANNIDKTMLKHVIVAKVSDILPFPKSLLVDFVLKYVKHKVPSWKLANYYKYKDILSIGAGLTLAPVSATNTDIAFLQYTGGTTGIPKGAMLTHRNVIASMLQIAAWTSPITEVEKEKVVSILPFFHIAGTIHVMIFLYSGALDVLIANPLDTKTLIKTLKKYQITVISGVSRLYHILLQDPEFASIDFSHLKYAITSGMSIQRSIGMHWEQITHKVFTEGYGATEAALGIACNPFNLTELNGTVGLPIPSTEISIRNDKGEELDFEYPGEIWIRGPQIMAGYWNQPEETQNALTSDGWFKTGDIGIITEQGFVRLIDRKKDIIYILGFQVFPSEVEAVIMTMPGVKEAAVVDARDVLDDEEIVKAFVVAHDPNLTAEQVIAYCKKNLPYYKVPSLVVFRKELPKNPVGKILRRSLRSEA